MSIERVGIWAVVLCFQGMMMCASPGRADNYPDCTQIPRCRATLVQAKQYAEEKNYAAALEQYQRSFQEHADPRLLYNLARMLQLLDRSEEAVPMYQRFLRSGVESSPERLARASEYLRHAEQRVLLVQRVAQQPAALALLCPTRRASYALPDFSVGLLTGAPVLRPIPRVPTYRRGWLWGTVGAVASTIAIVAGLSWYAHPPTCPRCTIQ